MFKPGGVVMLCDGEFVRYSDAVTCAHCQRISERKTRPFIKGIQRDAPDDIGGICGGCGKIICFACAGERECVTIEKRLDEMERQHQFAPVDVEAGKLL